MAVSLMKNKQLHYILKIDEDRDGTMRRWYATMVAMVDWDDSL